MERDEMAFKLLTAIIRGQMGVELVQSGESYKEIVELSILTADEFIKQVKNPIDRIG